MVVWPTEGDGVLIFAVFSDAAHSGRRRLQRIEEKLEEVSDDGLTERRFLRSHRGARRTSGRADSIFSRENSPTWQLEGGWPHELS
jgi:hypothetical protein